MGISTHILDTSRGRPAAAVAVTLSALGGGAPEVWTRAETDADGRVKVLVPADRTLVAGAYRLEFDVASYFGRLGVDAFYPRATIDFLVKDPSQHFHVPLLLQPFGFSTYRGS